MPKTCSNMSQAQQQRRTHRPWDELGAPAAPLDFPRPRFDRGQRGEVCCYIPSTGKHQVLQNVLFRDVSREFPDGDAEVQYAYYPLPDKAKINTIMGHVEICILLERCAQDKSSDSEDDDVMLGEGAACVPCENDEDVVFQPTSTYVAVKINYCDRMEQLRNRHAEDPLKEIAAMQLIGNEHPNVLGCREVLFDGKNLNVVLPFCNRGDLFQLLQDGVDGDGPGMSEGQARYWFRQVMRGIRHLHDVGVCHRDLSPENVMINDDNSLIIDMGMCLRVPYVDPSNPDSVVDATIGRQRRLFTPQGVCGKLPYMSPEIYKNRKPFDGEAVDVWTAGTILFCMVTGNRSYGRPHITDAQFYWMTNGLSKLLQDWGVEMSSEGYDMLSNMLKVDPRERLTIDEVLNHPWFTLPDEPPPF